MRMGGSSHVGQVREINEDAFWCGAGMLVVADGMGGHAAGEVASRLALDTVVDLLGPLATQPEKGAAKEDFEALSRAIDEAVHAANREIFAHAQADPTLKGMGTTLTLALIRMGRVLLGHVGDSRAYLIHNGELVQLTEDHSVVWELVRSGGISRAEIQEHPYRNLLTRALGTARGVDVDLQQVRLGATDGLLLCTDGLTAVLADGEIARIIARHPDPQEAADSLIRAANKRGGPDNITALVAVPGAGQGE